MKNLFIIAALMITLVAKSQARLGVTVQEIYDEFKELGIIYVTDEKNGSYLLFYPDPNVSVQYYFYKDSICTETLIQAFTQEMADYIINGYKEKGYLKVYDGWLMRDNEIIFKIAHVIEKNGTNLFLFY